MQIKLLISRIFCITVRIAFVRWRAHLLIVHPKGGVGDETSALFVLIPLLSLMTQFLGDGYLKYKIKNWLELSVFTENLGKMLSDGR